MKLHENLFTPTDHAIVRASVASLPRFLAEIIEMRFWHQMTIVEIAIGLGRSVLSVEAALSQATQILREECLRQPAFSRATNYAHQLNQFQGVA